MAHSSCCLFYNHCCTSRLKGRKQTLQDIGKGIEYTGYGLLGIASIVGIAAPIIAIIAAATRDRREHSGGGSNLFFISNNWGNSSPVNPSSRNPSSNEPIENYFYWSIGLSVLGIILALALEVAWVALMVAGLWVAGAAVLLLGKQVTAYAERQTEDATHTAVPTVMVIPPSAPVMQEEAQEQMPPVMVILPSAPVMQQEAQLQEPIKEPGSEPSNSIRSKSSLWANPEGEPGAPVPLNYTPSIGLI